MRYIWGIVFCVMIGQYPASGNSLIVNGSFEESTLTEPMSPDGFVTISASPSSPDSSITGWLIQAGTDVDLVSTAWQASDGSLSLDLNGRQGGRIYQAFATTPNQVYDVTFELAANPFNAPVPANVRVSAAGVSEDFSFDRTGYTPTNMGWQTQSWWFQATASTTTLSFETLVAGAGGNALDNVAVRLQLDPRLLFFDDFEDEPEPADERGFSENYEAFQAWDVQGSGVDLMARRFFPDQGIVVDLDGTSGSTLTTKESFELNPGTYELSFDLGGPLGGILADTVVVALGDVFSDAIDVQRGSPFESFSRQFVIDQPMHGQLSFTDLGADSNGAFLDNVRLYYTPSNGSIIGDFNRDGLLTVDDIDELSLAVGEQATNSKYDVNADGSVNESDRIYWVTQIKHTVFGDANFDREFNSSDLIQVLVAGEYADGVAGNSTWAEGDFGGDHEFDTDDLTLALQTGAYEMGPIAVSSAVPEPTLAALLWPAFLVRLCSRRREQS